VKSPGIPKQVISLVVILVVALGALITARILFVPASFGKYGHYRADAVTEIAQKPIQYAGTGACAECHDDIYQNKQASHHRGLSCEVCHGPAAQHTEAPDEHLPKINRDRSLCVLCHGYNPSRPTGFPQITAELHNPGKACILCHSPHSPTLPHSPDDCSACHGGISNEKAVSPHADLECVTCHEVPADHLLSPRLVLALKPTTREFCGRCHAQDATSSSEIPRVELVSHGGRYLCWDCHYPHHPEAK
jgi:hypothetical protein